MDNGDLLIADVARWIEPATVAPYFLDLAAPVLLDSSRSDGRLGRYSYFSAAPAMLLESTAGTQGCPGERVVGCALGESRLYQVPIRVNGSIKVAPAALDFDVGLAG